MLRLLGWVVIRQTELLALQRGMEGQEKRLAALRSDLLGQQESLRMLVAENHRLRNTPEFAPFTPELNAGEGRTGIELPSLEASSLEAGSLGLSGGKAE